MEDVYEKVIDLARRRGYVWPSGEIYGSVAGFIDYGPLGAMMKRRIEDIWREFYIVREGYYEIECPTIGIEPIYVASGHLKGFSDKMFQCPGCQEFFRADHVAEEYGIANAQSLAKEELSAGLADKPCTSCKKPLTDILVFEFNLMFSTSIGPGGHRKGYLRPETAQGIFTDFARLLRFYRDALPFGAVQIGRSYRNEISPRQGMIRLREFTQAEAEIFVHPDKKDHPDFSRYADYTMPFYGIEHQEKESEPETLTVGEAVLSGLVASEYVAYYLALTHDYMVRIGVDREKIRFRQHLPDERAHYAADCWDAEFYSERFGWVEAVGIADRTDYDLRAHAEVSGEKMTVFIQYPEPRTERRVATVPKMGLLGPRFRNRAKEVGEKIAAAEPQGDTITITLDGEEIEIGCDLFEVRDEEVLVRGEEVRPHVIEPSYGIDRLCYAVLEHAFHQDEVEGETRTSLRLPPAVAPVQVAVFPLMNRDGLEEMAGSLAEAIRALGIVTEYDDSGAIGRRYRRQDEIGTPYAITIDYESKDDAAATLRERDSMQQVRVPLDEIPSIIRKLIRGELQFSGI
ncbi:MAG: glycine--tRNA ligase [Methanocalculus sp. MSAO_Arc1]|uniref:glycine--tRNA ligase n=1 Tax=Methanocalculus TaxID=71151 RepID=UPI000FF07722|nr:MULTISPECIES: glycine--tRNA ligase [unclassified Methanocalculus]MCP1662570.1 glycyl-tRNA synthetase [Methanocalculus sp. AMF5]RQD81840.1 MAG: glycine--tRNA ligase [Methanocalculus sp. MSAO_Arc1]